MRLTTSSKTGKPHLLALLRFREQSPEHRALMAELDVAHGAAFVAQDDAGRLMAFRHRKTRAGRVWEIFENAKREWVQMASGAGATGPAGVRGVAGTTGAPGEPQTPSETLPLATVSGAVGVGTDYMRGDTVPGLAAGTLGSRGPIPENMLFDSIFGVEQPAGTWAYWGASYGPVTFSRIISDSVAGSACLQIGSRTVGSTEGGIYAIANVNPNDIYAFPIRDTQTYGVGMTARRSGTLAGNRVQLVLLCYDRTLTTLLGTLVPIDHNPPPAAWSIVTTQVGPGLEFTWPTGTAWVKVVVRDISSGAGAINLVGNTSLGIAVNPARLTANVAGDGLSLEPVTGLEVNVDGTTITIVDDVLQANASAMLDGKVKASGDDTTPGYLEDKIAAGTGITKTTLSPAGNEQVSLAVTDPDDDKVKVSTDDTTPKYLEDAITVSGGVTKSTTSPGGNEKVDLAVHAEEHDHDGSPTQKLTQANTHESADTDSAQASIHHTVDGSTTPTALDGSGAAGTAKKPSPADHKHAFAGGHIIYVKRIDGLSGEIQAAIDTITDSSSVIRYVVIAPPGEYYEQVTIGRDGISLIAEQLGSVKMKKPAAAGGGIVLAGDYINIAKLEVDAGGTVAVTISISANSEHILIENCIIHVPCYDGILLGDSGISDVKILNNIFLQTETAGEPSWDCINVRDQANVVIRGNIINYTPSVGGGLGVHGICNANSTTTIEDNFIRLVSSTNVCYGIGAEVNAGEAVRTKNNRIIVTTSGQAGYGLCTDAGNTIVSVGDDISATTYDLYAISGSISSYGSNFNRAKTSGTIIDGGRIRLIDEPWDNITTWTTVGTGTVEESPSGQLHLLASHGVGTDINAGKYRLAVAPGLKEVTAEILVKFDQLAGGFDGADGTTRECFEFTFYNGANLLQILFSSDSVWFNTASGVWTKQFDATFDNTSWYRFRIVCGDTYAYLFVSDDGGAWSYLGACQNAIADATFSGLVRLRVVNFRNAGAATTEVHVDNFTLTPGADWPLIAG